MENASLRLMQHSQLESEMLNRALGIIQQDMVNENVHRWKVHGEHHDDRYVVTLKCYDAQDFEKRGAMTISFVKPVWECKELPLAENINCDIAGEQLGAMIEQNDRVASDSDKVMKLNLSYSALFGVKENIQALQNLQALDLKWEPDLVTLGRFLINFLGQLWFYNYSFIGFNSNEMGANVSSFTLTFKQEDGAEVMAQYPYVQINAQKGLLMKNFKIRDDKNDLPGSVSHRIISRHGD